jgi:hypothetical protein
MKTTFHTAALATMLLLVQPAVAEIVTLVNAVETSPSSIILPSVANGMMTFNTCAGECEDDFRRARITAETRFTVDGKAVKFEDFRREFADIKLSKTSYALVSYATDTNTVTRIDINR